MKNTVIKSVLALVMAFMALPMMGQDFMSIYFKDGSYKKIFLDKLVEFATLKVGADGLPTSEYRCQHVVTKNCEYLFDLSEIDSIRFIKISKEQLNHNYQSALEIVLPALSECKAATDVERLLEIIKKTDSVEDAWCDEVNCFVKIKDGETISFHFSHVANEDETDMNRSIEKVTNCLKGLKNDIKPNGEIMKVAIIFQMYKDKSRIKYINDYLDPLERELETLGIEVDRIDSLTIDFFHKTSNNTKQKTIFDYDMTFLITHGDYKKDSKTHNILLSTELGIEKKRLWSDWSSGMEDVCHKNLEIYRDTVLNGLISDLDCVTVGYNEEKRDGEWYWVGYVNLSEDFFSCDKPEAQFTNPKSILFNGACQTLKRSDSFANILVERQKLGVYLGYNETTFLSEQTGYEWFHAILSGKSIWKAYEDLPDEHRIESGNLTNIPSWNYVNAQLLFRTKKNDYFEIFLFPTITEAIDQTEARACFDKNGFVEVKGYATSLDSKSISMGFLYGTDESLSSPTNVKVEDDIVDLPKPLDNGNGNVVFRGKLDNLELGNTYYYCAYTNDGTYFNCGDTLSFTISYPPLALSTNAITVSALTSSAVQITSGSGSYSIIDNTAPDVVTAKIIDNKSIVFEAHKAGPATITVKDDKSGQTATIEVMVTEGTDPVPYLTCPDDQHPHLIDLGLPSGTLWSCCNVGATSPEGYGGYYAWYETEEKDNYSWKTYIHCDGTGDTFHINELYEDGFSNRYDVAHVLWGGDWRMPTKKQTEELRSNCTYEWTEINGVMGGKFTSKSNGGSIFLPAAGWRKNINIYNVMNEGFYWTSSASIDEEDSWLWGYSFEVESWGSSISDDNPYQGLSVRPVTTPEALALSLNTLVMKIGQSTTVEITSGSGRYSIESISPQDVVTVEIKGNIVNIDALKAGSANITIKDTKSGQTSSINVAVIGGEAPVSYLTCPDDNHPHLIDLGLPSGTKWACCNVGATTPENYGDYYAWGETETKTKYNESKYKYYKDGNYVSLGSDIAGTQYDVALVKWGGLWVMPSYDQQTELRENCSFKWTSVNGINGRVFTGPNGGSIFLPASGYRLQGDLYGGNSSGYYWSSSQDQSRSNYAYLLYLESRGINSRQSNRYYGQNVRPVVR